MSVYVWTISICMRVYVIYVCCMPECACVHGMCWCIDGACAVCIYMYMHVYACTRMYVSAEVCMSMYDAI